MLSTSRIFLYQILTLGIYFFIWCYHLGKELSIALKRPAVPSMWWFVLPGGAYYWIWRMAESLEIATGKRIRRNDTFLWYVVLTAGLFAILQPLPTHHAGVQDSTDAKVKLVLFIVGILVVALLFITSILHATYMAIIQKRLNVVRGATD